MPQPNDHLFDLKHRLVGAAVLFVAAIIILPLVLTGQRQDHRRVSIDTGDAFVPIQQTFISRVGVDSSDVPSPQVSSHNVSGASNSIKQSDIPKSTKDVENQDVDNNQPENDSVGLVSGWVVRVGVFQMPENAKKRESLLNNNGFTVNLEEAKLDGKTAIRVFLGPFLTEEEAERMKAQAVMVTNDKAFVARYP